jgi:purine operon repressor
VEHIRRGERLVAITRILTDAPNRSFSLGYFCDAFGAAKSTISEDLDILRVAMERFALGSLETLPGAAGGVRYRPQVPHPVGYRKVSALCERLGEAGRVLPGGLLFMADVIADPAWIGEMGEVLASEFYPLAPDFVLTMETQGIPLAMTTARALHVPVIIARRSGKAYEGPAVHISYPSGNQFKTMSLGRRLVQPGQRALLVDDVLRSGGTAAGMLNLMREFSAEVVGTAMLVATEEAASRFPDIKALMIIEAMDGTTGAAKLRPGDWLKT